MKKTLQGGTALKNNNVITENVSSLKSTSLFAKKKTTQNITYPGFSPSPHASLWPIASCRPSSYNHQQLKDEWGHQRTKKKGRRAVVLQQN